MVSINRSYNSCGIKEVEGIGGKTPLTILREVWKEMHHSDGRWSQDCALMTFSDKTRNKTVEELRDYMHENVLGTTTYFGDFYNPNSQNKISLLIWEFSQEKLDTWFEKNKPDLSKIKVRKFKVLDDYCSHRAPIGSTVTMRVDEFGNEMSSHSYFYFKERMGNMIHFDEVKEITD